MRTLLMIVCAVGCSRQNPIEEIPDLATSADLASAGTIDLATPERRDLALRGDAAESDAARGDDAAPGDGSSADLEPVAPRIIAGGGVGDAPLAGTLHVYVIDSSSGSAIGGAAVHVLPGSGGALDGTTDGTGLADFHAAGLSGPAQITASASGHTTTTFIGADGTNVTLALELPLTSFERARAQLDEATARAAAAERDEAGARRSAEQARARR